MDEAEHCSDPHRLGDIHDRLLAIDAYAAPARASISRLLNGITPLLINEQQLVCAEQGLRITWPRIASSGQIIRADLDLIPGGLSLIQNSIRLPDSRNIV